MQIQPAAQISTSGIQSSQSVFLSNGAGGDGRSGGEIRADWNVRVNVSHETGFVGGAGRLLIHNLVMEEKRELTLLLPAALADRPGRLELATATVCSAKPGMAAAPGQSLPFRPEGAKVVVTIPTLQINDWVYIDLTWTGAFAPGGTNFPGAQIPIGEFHPQIATARTTDTGQQALVPHAARYDVTLGSDLGAVVRLEEGEPASVVTHTSEDGTMSMHEFKSYGSSRIDALLAPPGSLAS